MKRPTSLNLNALLGFLGIVFLLLLGSCNSKHCPDMGAVNADYTDAVNKDNVKFTWSAPTDRFVGYKVKIFLNGDSLTQTSTENLFYIQPVDTFPEGYEIQAEVSGICARKEIKFTDIETFNYEPEDIYYGTSSTATFPPPGETASVAIVFPRTMEETDKDAYKRQCDCTKLIINPRGGVFLLPKESNFCGSKGFSGKKYKRENFCKCPCDKNLYDCLKNKNPAPPDLNRSKDKFVCYEEGTSMGNLNSKK